MSHRLGQKTVPGVAIAGMMQVSILITPVTMNSALRERLTLFLGNASTSCCR
jgi:hypothetical protein